MRQTEMSRSQIENPQCTEVSLEEALTSINTHEYTKNQIDAVLNEYFNSLPENERPSKERCSAYLKRNNGPSIRDCIRHYDGKFSEILRAFGYDLIGSQRYSQRELKSLTDDYVCSINGKPSRSSFNQFLNEKRGMSVQTLLRRLFDGQFSNFLDDYGFNMDEEQAKNAFKEEYFRILPNSMNEFDKEAERKASFYKKRTGMTYTQLVAFAEPFEQRIEREYRDLWSKLGRQPKAKDMIENGINVKRGGTYRSPSDFMNHIGLNPQKKHHNYRARCSMSCDEMIQLYTAYSNSIGENYGASIKQIDEAVGMPSSNAYLYKFGNMTTLRTKAGFEPLEEPQKDKMIEEGLMRLFKEKGRLPYRFEVDGCEYLPDTKTIYRRFRSSTVVDVYRKINHKAQN